MKKEMLTAKFQIEVTKDGSLIVNAEGNPDILAHAFADCMLKNKSIEEAILHAITIYGEEKSKKAIKQVKKNILKEIRKTAKSSLSKKIIN